MQNFGGQTKSIMVFSEEVYCNNAFSRGNSARFAENLKACNTRPDGEGMGPSNNNHASLLRNKVQETSTVLYYQW